MKYPNRINKLQDNGRWRSHEANDRNFIKMNIESIGTWAGEVYKALEAAEDKTLGMKQLKKATKLKKDELMAAIGWLGREGKLDLSTDGEEVVMKLV